MAGPVSALRRVGKSIADQVAELVRLGYPESTAKKIASGELPMDQASRMARAREQGFDVDRPMFHGTNADFTAFDRSKIGTGPGATPSVLPQGAYFGRRPDELDDYATGEGANIIPAYLRRGKIEDGTDLEAMRRFNEGDADTFRSPAGVEVVKDPSNIRSVNAAFDPDQVGNPNLLAGSAAAAVGLGAASQSEDADAGVVTRGGKRLIEAFHGSPHKFDRFSMENIGTGEGAQAYGHGLYFADSEDVARGYRDNLSAQPTVKMATDGDPEEWAAHLVKMHGGEDQAMLTLAGVDGDRLTRPHRVAAYEAIKSGAYKKFKVNDGSLYKVDIDVDPDTLLDWDKPLGEQSEAVKSAFAKVAAGDDPLLGELFADGVDATYLGVTERSTGGQIYNTLSEGKQAELSARLNELGIPGIRYLDGNSRSAGEGSYNYVMFDDKPISIRERGMVTPEMAATMAAGGAAGVAATQDTPAWMQSAMQNIAPEEEAEIDRRITQRLRGAQYRKRSRQRENRYAGIRESLLSGVTAIDRSIGSAFQAIEMPYQGYLGLTRAAGGLMAGESPQQALMQGAQDARQPIDQTAYDMGGAVTDATGSPMAGAVVNTAVNMGGF